jgi:hypothetical protein
MHFVVAMDLPCDDSSASFDTYAEWFAWRSVGAATMWCSLGGHTLPLVTACRPERHVVYVCAHIPDIGRSLADELRDAPDMLNRNCSAGLSEPDAQRRTTWVDHKLARLLLYADCDEPTVKAAINRIRPQASYPHAACSLTEFPSVRSTSVVCREDRMLGFEWRSELLTTGWAPRSSSFP